MNIHLSKTSFYRHFYLKFIVNSSFAIYTCGISKDGKFGYYMSHLIMVIERINYRTRYLTGSNACFVSFNRRGFFKKLILSLFSVVPKKLFHYHYFFFTTLYYAPGKFIYLRIK